VIHTSQIDRQDRGYICPLWSDYSICVTARTSATTALVVDNISFQRIYSTENIPAPTNLASIPYDYAYPLQIRWKDSDFGQQPGNSSSVAQPSSAVTSRPASKESLSPGTIAGIVVGIVLFCMICLGGFVWWMRRRNSVNAHGQAQSASTNYHEKPELEGEGVASAKQNSQVQNHELGTSMPSFELDSTAPRAELDPGTRS
jgi:hypothetical protein